MIARERFTGPRDGEQLVDLLLVLGEVHGGAGVTEQVLDLGGRVGGYRPTVMPRTATVAMSRITHSGRSSEWIDTRSPGWTPRARRAWPASRTSFQTRSQVYSCQMPRSFSRIATWCGARRAQSRASVATVVTLATGGGRRGLMSCLRGDGHGVRLPELCSFAGPPGPIAQNRPASRADVTSDTPRPPPRATDGCSHDRSVMNSPIGRQVKGGPGRIRTSVGNAGRFTVCSLWPLGYRPSRPRGALRS